MFTYAVVFSVAYITGWMLGFISGYFSKEAALVKAKKPVVTEDLYPPDRL